MKRAIFYSFMFFIGIPMLKMYTDTLTDVNTGILYIAGKAMAINGVHNPAGDYLLLLWQVLPWALGVFIVVEVLRWIGGRKKDKEQQQGGIK